MLKSVLLTSSLFFVLLAFVQAQPLEQDEQDEPVPAPAPPPPATFLKPTASVMRRLNPLKLLFVVAHTPGQSPAYSVEWNLSLLRTMLLESSHVSNDDKRLFLLKFSNTENDYAQWTPEQRDQLERFTEKYFNPYESAGSFLPLLDCPALTYAITDELLKDLQPHISEDKRWKIRALSVERLCGSA